VVGAILITSCLSGSIAGNGVINHSKAAGASAIDASNTSNGNISNGGGVSISGNGIEVGDTLAGATDSDGIVLPNAARAVYATGNTIVKRGASGAGFCISKGGASASDFTKAYTADDSNVLAPSDPLALGDIGLNIRSSA
jgi:hypothetical protein